MSVFFDNAITDSGRQLWAEMQLGGVFTPTKIVIGSGYMPQGKTPRTMTAVAEVVKNLSLNKKRPLTSGDFVFGAAFTNEDVETAFYFRELALFAKVVRADQTETSEVLYSYGNAGDNAELIPAYSAGSLVERQMDIISYIGNDAEVNLEVASGTYATSDEASITDKDILESGTILEWANSLSVNTTKLIDVNEHAPSDLPVRQSGFLSAILGPDHIKVIYTPYAWFNGITYSRDINNGTYLQAWESSVSVRNMTVYLDPVSGDDFYDGQDPTQPMKTIAAALNKFAGARSIYLALAPGTYNENASLEFQNYHRIGIYRYGSGDVTIKGSFRFLSGYARVENVKIDASAMNAAAVDISGVNCVLANCTVTANSNQENVSVYNGTALMQNVNFVGGKHALMSFASQIGVENGSISGAGIGLYASAGVIRHEGLTNNASVAKVTYSAGQIIP